MDFERVRLDIEGPVATLTLNHPEVMNAVSAEMLVGLMKALDEVEDEKNGVRCLVMTGEGRGFCTGANLQGRNDNKSGRSDAGLALETSFHPFL
ncbi:MAG TPA: enoyl-CoA hydratase-related protein, partial [Parvibaculum sp.]